MLSLIGAVGLTGLLGLTGCQDPLFPTDAPRTPYQRYQTLRDQDRPESRATALGGRQPALRQRLRPLDQP